MKKRLWILPLALIAAAGLFMTGCEDMWADQDALVRTSGIGPQEFDIIAGQNDTVGELLVWENGDDLVVDVLIYDPWEMTESALAWADDCANLPRNKKGHLVPGNFPLQTDHDPAVTEFTYRIPLDSIVWGYDEDKGEYYVALAFHAVVRNTETNQEETGWGGEWKGCFKYWRREGKDVKLPTYWVEMLLHWPWEAEECYFRVELKGIGTGFNVWDSAYWRGWCAEWGVSIDTGIWYDVKLHSSQGSTLPDRAKNGLYGPRRWDRVNWLLNNMSKYTDATWVEFQRAIWYLLGDYASKPAGLAGQIADDAITYGTGFWAEEGELLAVIMEPKESEGKLQFAFIEVDP
ncbi:MAG: hypothetical protein JSU73_13970 [candidate division WOR-3 bacterium]|nr:MAG: hypothetical protein JSU73_13970 [candidate division WOR-3 bacterium]